MIRIKVICEGETEQNFSNSYLNEMLSNVGVSVTGMLVKGVGGNLNYDRVQNFLKKQLKYDTKVYVTTFFDYYALPKNFPGFQDLSKFKCIYEKCQYLEQALIVDIEKEIGDLKGRFFPHIQPHEFEALLFTDINKLIELEEEWQNCEELILIKDKFASPEHINNKIETSPSHRIQEGFKGTHRKYSKPYHGLAAIKNISLGQIRKECLHFNAWYEKILKLANSEFHEQN